MRMLLGWATREGWKPTYADLDIGQGSITVPGTISATPVEMPIHPIEGVPLDLPLVYFYGHTTPRWVSMLRMTDCFCLLKFEALWTVLLLMAIVVLNDDHFFSAIF